MDGWMDGWTCIGVNAHTHTDDACIPSTINRVRATHLSHHQDQQNKNTLAGWLILIY